MLISRLTICNLFGFYTYELDFASMESSVMLITGPNGYGKTTILKILAHLNVSNLYFFYKLRFDSIQVAFAGGDVLRISRMPDDEVASPDEELKDVKLSKKEQVHFVWVRNNKEVASLRYSDAEIYKALRKLRYTNPELNGMLQRRRWASGGLDEFLLKYKELNETIAENQGQDGFIMQLQTLRATFIPANRIYSVKSHPVEDVVARMKDFLENIRKRYVDESKSDDALLIQELLSDSGTGISEQEYEQKCKGVRELLSQFSSYIPIQIEIPPYKEQNSAILSYYMSRLERKLQKFADEIAKVSLFDRMLKSKRFANKRIVFSPQHGIKVTMDAGDAIDATSLSSGEQNELVMLYQLIFEVSNQSVLLIDEPENSLHVAWQKMVVSDLASIAAVKKLQLLVATHSSTIVSQGRAQAVDLYYLQKQYRDEA